MLAVYLFHFMVLELIGTYLDMQLDIFALPFLITIRVYYCHVFGDMLDSLSIPKGLYVKRIIG